MHEMVLKTESIKNRPIYLDDKANIVCWSQSLLFSNRFFVEMNILKYLQIPNLHSPTLSRVVVSNLKRVIQLNCYKG
jgi:hypothetical protein